MSAATLTMGDAPLTMGAAPLIASSELTIYQVAELKPLWWAALDEGCTELELSAVLEIDGAGLQLVLALWHATQQQGRSLQLLNPSGPVSEALQLVGAGHLLPAIEEAPHA